LKIEEDQNAWEKMIRSDMGFSLLDFNVTVLKGKLASFEKIGSRMEP
jgi:hypothetical protein